MHKFIFALLLLFCGGAAFGQTATGWSLPVGPGPEDMVIDSITDGTSLIVSCTERRDRDYYAEFHRIPLGGDESFVLPRINEPSTYQPHFHGIDLVEAADGNLYLYAISHGLSEKDKEHYVLKYRVEAEELVYLETFSSPKCLKSPNDLTATPDGDIYVSNDLGGGLQMIFRFLFGIRASSIAHYHDGEWSLAAKKFRYANGIRYTGESVLLSTTAGGKLYELPVEANGGLGERRIVAKKLKGLDNIELTGNDWIYITRHPSNGKFLKHVKNEDFPSPSEVWKINVATGETKRIFADDGTNVPAASTAICYRDVLYIAQVFNGWIWAEKLESE